MYYNNHGKKMCVLTRKKYKNIKMAYTQQYVPSNYSGPYTVVPNHFENGDLVLSHNIYPPGVGTPMGSAYAPAQSFNGPTPSPFACQFSGLFH